MKKMKNLEFTFHPDPGAFRESPNFIDQLMSPLSFQRLLSRLNIVENSHYLRSSVFQLIFLGLGANKKLAIEFTKGNASLNTICSAIASTLNASGLKFDAEDTLRELEPKDHKIHKATLEALSGMPIRTETLRLFSFGIGRGNEAYRARAVTFAS